MGKKEYYGSAQFEPLLGERDYEDKYISDIIRLGGEMDIDISESMVTDIMGGNTAVIRRTYKHQERRGTFSPVIIDGTEEHFHKIIEDHTFYGVYPIRDDYSTAMGVESYADLPDDDERKIEVGKVLDQMNMDWEEVINKVITPDPIPEIGTSEWIQGYQQEWDDNETLRFEYSDNIVWWRDQLLADLRHQEEAIPDITDMNIGFYATGASTRDAANVNAIYWTFADWLPKVTFNGYQEFPMEEKYPSSSYLSQYKVQYFTVVNGWTEWSHVVRVGRVGNDHDDPGTNKYRNKKSSYEVFVGDSAKRNHTTGDPIHEIIHANPRDGSFGSEYSKLFKSCLEIQVQLKPLDDGTQIYGEIRIWDYGSMHAITGHDGHTTTIKGEIAGDTTNILLNETEFHVDSGSSQSIQLKFSQEGVLGENVVLAKEGDYGYFDLTNDLVLVPRNPYKYSTQKVYYLKVIHTDPLNKYQTSETGYITIRVDNTQGQQDPPFHPDPFSGKRTAEVQGQDLVFFPLQYKEGAKKVAFWERERFIRESAMLGIYSINVVKLKWYEAGWFKVVIFIVALIVAVVTGPAGWAGLLSLKTIAVAAVKIILIQVVGMVLVQILGSMGWITGALIFIYGVMSGNIQLAMNLQSFSTLANVVLDTANNYIKIKMQEVMEDLQEQLQKLQDDLRAAKVQMTELIEEAGGIIRADESDITLALAMNPDTEDTGYLMQKGTEVGNALITDVDAMVDVHNSFPTQLR